MASLFATVLLQKNRAISHGISHLVGSIEIGKVADLVAFDPAFFGTKPSFRP